MESKTPESQGAIANEQQTTENRMYSTKTEHLLDQAGPVGIRGNINLYTAVGGTVPFFIMLFTVGPVLVTSLQEAGVNDGRVIAWFTAIHIFAGLTGLILAIYYRQPIVCAYSIAGVAIVSSSLSSITLPQAMGACIAAGVLVLLAGLTGTISTVLRYIPTPIMSAMIAGVLLSFPLQIVEGTRQSLAIGASAVTGYIIVHRWVPRTPGILGALLLGVSAAAVLGGFNPDAVNFAMAFPQPVVPGFSFASLISVSVPLAIAVIGADNVQAIATLRAFGFRPPVNAMTIASGIGGILAGLCGGHNSNIAGPATAAVAGPDAGPLRGRYVAALFSGTVVTAFGVFAPIVVQVFELFPEALMMVLVGLVLLPIVASLFVSAWKEGGFVLSAMAAFVVAFSGVSILGVSAAFWSILVGCLAALLLETRDYKNHLREWT